MKNEPTEESMKPKKINDSVYYIGAFDPDLRTFDIIMKTANGTSYNSYLVKGSTGNAIVDTVKPGFEDQFFAKLESLVSYDSIHYIILNHLEPDHSGTVLMLKERAPQAKILVSSRGKVMFKALINQDLEFDTVKTGDSISLGDKTLEFLDAPFLHWPETMMTYLKEDKLLFSCDVFAAHYDDDRIFNDEVGDFEYSYKYYYDHIMRPYKSFVIKALDALSGHDISIIAPSHGPVLRENVAHYMDLYREWSSTDKNRHDGKKLVNIFYASSYGNTRRMAEKVLNGLNSDPNIIASMYDAEAIEYERAIYLLEIADAFLMGTPTINSDAVKPIWDITTAIPFVEMKGKKAGVFGSYGWGGEATNLVQERLRGLKIKLPLEPLKVKLTPSQEELEQCLQFGKDFAQKLNETGNE